MFFIRFSFIILSTFLFNSNTHASGSVRALIYQYIDQYKAVAVSEMHRTGIPASIKLAQGLLESDFGRSKLAHDANNHFGIKCGSKWEGNTFYKKDDDYKNGKLINSCFRTYGSGEESYIEHSEFLRDPNKAYRYGFLFGYASNDYVAWALGLRQAGYATDPKYPDKLISIIEKYELFKFDEVIQTDIQEIAVQAPKNKRLSNGPSPVIIPKEYKIRSQKKHRTYTINDVRYVKSKLGDSPASLAKMYSISTFQILAYNEQLTDKNQILEEGQRVFLGEKKKSFKSKKFHIVRRGQRMADISSIYGIDLDVLHSRNHIKVGEEPKAGEKIQLKGIRLGKAVCVQVAEVEPEFLFDTGIH